MLKKTNLYRGLTLIFVLCLTVSIAAALLMEQYRDPLDAQLGTQSSRVETLTTGNEDEIWNFDSQFKTAEEAFNGFRDFALKEAPETFTLLKNTNNALPLTQANPRVTMMGLRSYAPVYGNSGGSIADKRTTEDNLIYDAFAEQGFQLNPSMLATYKAYCDTLAWGPSSYGARPPEYVGLGVTDDIPELSLGELNALNSSYNSQYGDYNDAAIVVVGRPGGENKFYYPGQDGMVDGLSTTTDNIFGLSTEEMQIIDEAKSNFDKVIVLINSTNAMEFANLKDDPEIDAILWIGYPGAYGFHSVAKVLKGEEEPSGHLGDTFAKNNALAPAMMNFGDNKWANPEGTFSDDDNVNSYLVMSEGIYTGYRYYETRYADIVEGKSGAATAKAGTYANANGKPATADGTWSYANEMLYPFGYGMSYTSFTQTLDSVTIMGNKKTAGVSVTVTNTGNRAGKSVVQLYAQAPDVSDVEKSAIQLMDFEKTRSLAVGESQTINMTVDMANIASYDYEDEKTFIVDPGTYYFAIGNDVHDALNNILAAKGYDTGDGMTANGDATKTYSWTWGGEVDAVTFATSKNGTVISNVLSEGDYAMDINAFYPNLVTYLTRDNWNGTFPTTVVSPSGGNLVANERMVTLLGNDFIPLKTDDNVSDLKFGVDNNLSINDFKGAEFDDPRWSDLIDQVTVAEFLNFAANAFHHIEGIESVGLLDYNADDGPGGSDTHYLNEGQYRGVAYADGAQYAARAGITGDAGYGTRVAPSQLNLAYSWNKELAYENGEIILGESSIVLRLPIMIGPGMNIHRHAYNGRGGEYYSEDPILSGYIGSASVQGAQSKGCLVNIKHAAFNDQEIDRSGIAVFMNEQTARELELRNLRQAFEANGKPAAFNGDESKDDTYVEGALGVMTSYNRIGVVASSANRAVMVDIMRNEWGFKGYNVTDFTGVSDRAAPKESILSGTTAFCGFGGSVSYYNEASLSGDRDILLAVKQNVHYLLYALANSNALNGIDSTSRVVELMTSWRALYIVLLSVSGALTLASAALYVVGTILKKKEAK